MREILTHKQNSLLLEIIPKLVQEMNSKNSEMEQWIDRVHKQLSHKIQNEKIAVCKKSESRKMLQSSLKKSLDAICKNYEEILNDFKVQSSNISVLEDQFTKDIEERLNGLQMMANSFKELSQSQKEIRKKFSKRDDFLITSLEDNILKLQEMHQPLTNLCESESHTEEHKSALNEILTVMNINEFSVKHQSLIGSQNRVVSEFENFTRENAKEEEKIFLEAENSIKSNLSSLSQNAVNFEKHITDVRSSLENCIKSGEVSINENLANIKAAMLNTSSNITGSKEALDCVTSQLKEEILKRDIEFEKFISEDLLKDIPTGTTPHRKNYVYPTKFAATSPHDRILQRLRSKLAEDTKVAVNLPLDSSFNESDESPVSTIKNFGVSVEVNNASFSSDDSNCYDTDSSASYVSDASIESRKNKENIKKPKKKSRLPKKMPAKGFVKPAPPSIRKPLTTTNSEVAEQFDV